MGPRSLASKSGWTSASPARPTNRRQESISITARRQGRASDWAETGAGAAGGEEIIEIITATITERGSVTDMMTETSIMTGDLLPVTMTGVSITIISYFLDKIIMIVCQVTIEIVITTGLLATVMRDTMTITATPGKGRGSATTRTGTGMTDTGRIGTERTDTGTKDTERTGEKPCLKA